MRLLRLGVLAAFLAAPLLAGCKDDKSASDQSGKASTIPAGPKNPAGGKKGIPNDVPD